MERLPAARFVNVYGPAEVNACTIHHLPAAAAVAVADDVPIGRPVPIDEAGGTEVRVVDPDETGRGELWVRSPTMMKGYWRRPDLDSGVFVDDGDGRWYRTGDLGWRRHDGELVFAGRLDHQVKVRGHRIELEAVESVLEEQPGVAGAVAAVVRTPGGDDSLIAGLIAAPGRSYDPDDLLRSARERLPAYALPTRLLAVEELVDTLPTTGSGKLDRRSLRARLVEAHQHDRPHPAGSTQPTTDRTPVPATGPTPAPAPATIQEEPPS
jgi:acyl-CoA synthetase (AMP-forming)/AMP-acid ligase II